MASYGERPQSVASDMGSRQQEVVPEGFELKFTPKGIAYLEKTDDVDEEEEPEDEEARNEYATGKLSIFTSMDKVERRYGVGYRLYFNFVVFIQITNLVLTIITGINWGWFIIFKREGISFSTSLLFIGSYPASMRAVWIVTSIIATLTTFTFPPLYYFYLKKRFIKNHIPDHDNPFAFSGLGIDEIKENKHYSHQSRFWRRIASYIIFFGLLVASFWCLYGLQLLGNELTNPDEAINFWNFVVTGMLSAVNFIFRIMSRPLTAFEKHRTWGMLRKHVTVKFIAFKIFNLMGLYAALRFSFLTDNNQCGFLDSGGKFFSLMIFDMFVFSFNEFFLPVFRKFIFRKVFRIRGKGSDDEDKPEFDLAEEYLELFYRQFVVYLGMTVFPMITLMAFITNLMEYPLDKVRMLKVCQRPKRVDFGMRSFLILWLFGVAFLALISWPQGIIWMFLADKETGGSEGENLFPMHCCDILPDGDFVAQNGTAPCL